MLFGDTLDKPLPLSLPSHQLEMMTLTFIWPPKNFCQASLAVCSLSCCKICIEKEQHLTHLPKRGWKAFIPVIEPGDQRGTNFQQAALNRRVYGSATHLRKSQRRCLFTSFHKRTSPSCPCQLSSCQLMLSPQVFPPEPVDRSHSTIETCSLFFPWLAKCSVSLNAVRSSLWMKGCGGWERAGETMKCVGCARTTKKKSCSGKIRE